MPHTFLAAARQGRHQFQHYALSLVLMLALPTIATVLFAIFLALGMALGPGTNPATLQQWQTDPPPGLMAVALGILLLFCWGLILAVQAIHRRPWQTVIRGRGPIQWRRLGISLGVWLGLLGGNIALLALVTGDRYRLAITTWGAWFAGLPLALALALVAASTAALVYGYGLQGLGLWMRRPRRLAIALGMLGALLALPQGLREASLLGVVMAGLGAGFTVWLVMADQGMEVFWGLQIATLLVNSWIVGLEGATDPWGIPTLLTLEAEAPLAPGALTYGLRCALFAWLMLGVGRHWGRGANVSA
ncbi:MAG: hypothetical protein O3C67_00580 [Cyanobacteria bacterium]|nr:hypothetical protein [Cyanobacteriota bacterium]